MANKTTPREQCGMEIATKPDQIKRIDDNHYQVKSQTNGSWYDIVITEKSLTCTCPDSQWRKLKCKHCHAVDFSIKLREKVKTGITTIQEIAITICQFCQSQNIKKFAIRRNKSGNIQRFVCSDCLKTFVPNLGFEGMRATPKAITTAMQLYFSGESLRNVQKFLRLQGIEVSHVTIYNWISKYTGLMEKYLEKIVPNVSNTWRADEIYIKVKGNPKYLFALMDDETRFWIAQEMADKKEGHDARGLFAKGKEVAQKKPKVIITDGLKAYNEAYKREFYSNQKKDSAIHIRHITFNGRRHNNNKMERLNGEIRDREKVVRGLKKMDSPLIDGYQIYHNYVRPHMALDGETPADRCGIKIEGNNKWITLIQNASKLKK